MRARMCLRARVRVSLSLSLSVSVSESVSESVSVSVFRRLNGIWLMSEKRGAAHGILPWYDTRIGGHPQR